MIDFGLRGCHGPLPRAGKGDCAGRPVPAHIGSSVHIFNSAAGVSRRTDLPQHNTPGGPGRGGYGPHGVAQLMRPLFDSEFQFIFCPFEGNIALLYSLQHLIE